MKSHALLVRVDLLKRVEFRGWGGLIPYWARPITRRLCLSPVHLPPEKARLTSPSRHTDSPHTPSHPNTLQDVSYYHSLSPIHPPWIKHRSLLFSVTVFDEMRVTGNPPTTSSNKVCPCAFLFAFHRQAQVRLPSRSVYTARDTFPFVRPGCNYTSVTFDHNRGRVFCVGGKKERDFFSPHP